MELRTVVTVGVVVAACTILGASAPAAAQDDAGPRAEAGLDQEVSRNASVLLDASESWVPDGTIAEYDWTIEAPNGSTVSPACDSADCRLANFPAAELGTYTVTTTVEAADGATASDTMYVDVVPAGPFDVTLTGPANPSAGSSGNFTAVVSAGDATLERVEWRRSGSTIVQRNVSGAGGRYRQELSVSPGATYRVVVRSIANRTVAATWAWSPGGAWTPTSTPSDTYPRIEGPSVITGSPDSITSNGLYFEDISFRLVTRPGTELTGGYWYVDGWGVGDRLGSIMGESISVDLGPGVTTITLNSKFRASDSSHASRPESAQQSVNETIQEVSLSHTVVVDPQPRIQRFSTTYENGRINYHLAAHDEYGPIEEYSISIGGTEVRSVSTSANGLRSSRSIDIPSEAYGQTEVRIRVSDGRGQTTAASETVSLPTRDEERSENNGQNDRNDEPDGPLGDDVGGGVPGTIYIAL